MRLATRRNGTRDGALVVVDPHGNHFASAHEIAPSLQAALDQWEELSPRLEALSAKLARGEVKGEPLDVKQLHSPLPRAYEWVDGSAYINHIVLVRKARGAKPPETLETDPLVYQGGSGSLLSPTDDIPALDPSYGLDFEAEICVILGDTPRGVSAAEAAPHVKLLMLANDVTFRGLIPPELAKGFGFFTSKPATAFSPFAVTPDELGGAYRDGRVHLRLRSTLNGELVGDPEAGPEMHFSFYDLIAHITKTRAYTAGTILGSGTVSNADRARGISCLAEARMIETIEEGAPKTPFLTPGDHIEIELFDASGRSVFGKISQRVVAE
ncbi:MAG: fumarylacetoacetate hydrolase family protein [Polyangiaceae bacterium]|nr:fumarylacetoacetate hydrolase family protein [Polyangiaceae bacterium]MCW5789796.1 fumarylacetoacetate hydrolase family protein [Polyangiaceae bacterium]